IASVFCLSIVMVSTHTIAAPTKPVKVLAECANPTEVIGIEAGTQAEPDKVAFNTTELHASKNTCVQLRYKNWSSTTIHDFVIEEHEDSGFEGMDFDVDNNTVEFGYGPGWNAYNFTTPNKDVTLTFFCEQPGHQDLGMEGKLIVGEGSPASSPGFELPIFLASFVVVATVITTIRKRKA
ncbi:MAG: plastocyanin/azurin family copper-binding protein, partial [Candidatus Thorarchaeota archaeon]